ncbi:MAG TPA: hypothetical protein PLR22_09475, partial [Saprospiraceae bacterium]|nr:hypothetical protein [Saprospiraceae bacterium]
MKILTVPILILLTMAASTVLAQPLKTIPYQARIEKADEYADRNNYASQLDELEEVYKERKDKSMLPLMAQLNYKLRDYGRAENLYKRIVDGDKKGTDIEARYMYGKMLKLNGKYQEAAEVLREVKNTDDDVYAPLAIMELKGILLAVSTDTVKQISVVPAGPKINTKSGEYSPTLYNNELYFTSTALAAGEEPGNTYVVKLLKSQRDKDGGWSKASEV